MPNFAIELHLPLTFPRQGYYMVGVSLGEAIDHAHDAARRSGVRASVRILRPNGRAR